MAEKKKRKKETNSSSLIPEQSSRTLSERIRSQLSEQKSVEDFFSQLEESDSSQPSEEKSLEDIISQFIDRESLSFNGGLHTMNQLLTPPSPQMSEQKSVVDIMSQLRERLRLCAAPSAASEKIHAVPAQRVRPLSVSVNSYSSMNEPPSFHPQKTQSPQMSEQKSVADVVSRLKERLRSPLCSVSPSVSVKSYSSMNEPPDSHLLTEQSSPLYSVSPCVSVNSESSMSEPPDSHLKKTQSEPLSGTDSPVSHCSMKSNSSMYEPLFFNLKRKQSEPLHETDSTVSHCSMKSDSSMYEPLYFNHKRKQSQLTEEPSSCSVCEEAVKDPVCLLCGHWACKQCVCSHWYQYGLIADYSCKKCGKRSERYQDLQSVLLEKTIKRVEMETEKLQAEREKFELEKRKLALEIQSLEHKGK